MSKEQINASVCLESYKWFFLHHSHYDEERYHPLSITQIKFLRSKAVNGVVGQNLMEESFCTNNPPKIQHAKEDAHSQ